MLRSTRYNVDQDVWVRDDLLSLFEIIVSHYANSFHLSWLNRKGGAECCLESGDKQSFFFEKHLAFKSLPRFDTTSDIPVKNQILIGWTTTQSKEDALRLASGLVDNALAACTQVEGPLSSTYRWQGTIECSEEWRIAVKFPADRAEELEKWLLENHPYDDPQWLAVVADKSSSAYAKWVLKETGEQE